MTGARRLTCRGRSVRARRCSLIAPTSATHCVILSPPAVRWPTSAPCRRKGVFRPLTLCSIADATASNASSARSNTSEPLQPDTTNATTPSWHPSNSTHYEYGCGLMSQLPSRPSAPLLPFPPSFRPSRRSARGRGCRCGRSGWTVGVRRFLRRSGRCGRGR